jgi:gliding motility-associated-like protein
VHARSFLWDFGDNKQDTLKHPSYVYLNAGRFLVNLLASDTNGCFDTASLEIVVNEEEFLFVPNVFTPQGNGLNEVFEAVYTKSQFDFLELLVYSRWGELLHKTQMPGGVWWNGTYKDSPCPEGVYFYVLKAKSSTGKLYDLNGTITLIR